MRILFDPATPLPEHAAGRKLAVSYLRVSTTAQAETDYTDEGFSIPAQREANQRTAERLGAVIVAEFMDRGESAKTADRPELQAMLRFLRDTGTISYVIVHKVDRLARSREDDVSITLAIRKAGAQLVSATENIDETPSGKLLHGIMATIAEFYSQNLAMEAKKGMRQKAKAGGTLGLAPLGYRNVRVHEAGREIRTVAVDEDRAPHIVWMFEAYASGEYAMSQLATALEYRGLRLPATAKRPARAVRVQQIDKMLANRYYLGEVRFEGVWYPGRHPALITPALFEQVQAVRRGRKVSGEKVHAHPNYLKGIVFCGTCRSRLGITNATNRWGTVYPYFFCIGRAKRRTPCDQPAILIDDLEASVADWWRRVQLSPGRIADIRQQVLAELERYQADSQREASRQQKRIDDLQREQLKLLQAHYADALPLDLLKIEQERISRELAGATAIVERCAAQAATVLAVVEEVLLLCANAHQLYLAAPPQVRRALNQAVFTRFWVVRDRVEGADLAEPFAQLLAPGLPAASGSAAKGPSGPPEPIPAPPPDDDPAGRTHAHWCPVERPYGLLPSESRNPPTHVTGVRTCLLWWS
ncbi:MAG: recombinase family protein [Frankia sp.]|nr:recombinase family protein [Frankia sp.]